MPFGSRLGVVSGARGDTTHHLGKGTDAADASVSVVPSFGLCVLAAVVGTVTRRDTEDARPLQKLPGCQRKQVGALLPRCVARF